MIKEIGCQLKHPYLPPDLASLAGSKVSARSVSPGGSVYALSDRISMASGSLVSSVLNHTNHSQVSNPNPLSAQQLGAMGMEALENLIAYWEDALSAHEELNLDLSGEQEFFNELQKLLDICYNLQEQGEMLFLDQRSVLYRESEASHNASRKDKSGSDPNLDSAESFASALDQVADLREFEEFSESLFPNLDKLPLYQSTVRRLEEHPIPYR